MALSSQDAAVLQWLARQLCEYHVKDAKDWTCCSFCQKNYDRLFESYEYGRYGRLPKTLATKIINGE